jgi:hypothetical protein
MEKPRKNKHETVDVDQMWDDYLTQLEIARYG